MPSCVHSIIYVWQKIAQNQNCRIKRGLKIISNDPVMCLVSGSKYVKTLSEEIKENISLRHLLVLTPGKN